ncbi:heterokaryon incompatibility protein-domain-containing protein, partial [Bisporella sp. PMI_857]
MASQNNNIRPTRLLDLTPLHRLGKPGIRIIVTAANDTYQYACLSHRWDDRLKQHQLNVGNLARRLDFMILEDLPKNFHDAVSIARELNIQYLWIDTLCIIQSGDNGKDLEKELANMGYIYRNSYLTIAAVASADSAGGCLSNSMFRDMCFIISNIKGETHLIGARVLDQKGTVATIEDAVQRYPLFTRGWVWQERLLSPRLLQCDYGEFSFHCLKLKSCECSSRLPPHILKLRQAWPGTLNWEFRRYLSPVTRLSPNNDKETLMSCWRTITERFMQLELSVASDVLPAIAGCAEAIAYHRNFKYVAGMWKETLSTDLLWFAWPHKPFGFGKARPVQLSIPSWSWASMAMP